MREGYKETEIGLIPIDWEMEYIKDFATIVTGNKDTQNKVADGKYPFFVRSQTIERINSYSFDGEAVLTAGDGVGVGKIYHYLNEKFDYHQRVYNIHNFKDYVSGKYFYNYFKAYFYTRVSRMSAKNSVDSVRMDMIAKMPIPLPALKEQEKIADILSTADDKIEAIASQIEKAETLKKGLLQKLLSEGIGHTEFKDSELGRIPVGWEVKPLSRIGSFSKGKGISKNEIVEYGIPCMRYAEIYTEYDIVLKDIKSFINEKSALNSKRIIQGDILFAGSGETLDDIGKSVAFVDDFEAYVGGDTVILSATVTYNSLFMAYQLNASSTRTQLRKLGQGSSVVHIYSSGLEKVKVAFPSIEEQKQIADILSTTDNKLEVLRAKKEKYVTLKQGLMQKLLTGEIRVKL